MRFAKLAVLAALAVALAPAGAAAQERAQTGTALAAAIDQRLVVTPSEQRATLTGAYPQVRLRADGWNLYGAVDYMARGIIPGAVIGAVVGGVRAEDGLTATGDVVMGAVMGMAAGMATGIVVYTIVVL